MLTLEKAMELMHKYGFSSTSDYPYIYLNGNEIGVCYCYIDDNYGYLERIKLFDNEEQLEDFLKRLYWIKQNGKVTNSRMILEDYQISNPKILFLRNEKIMVKDEMFSIDEFNRKEAEKLAMDPVSRLLTEAGELIIVYDDLKAKQDQFLQYVRSLENDLRNKYFELQQSIDKYNKNEIEREVKLLPTNVVNKGINQMMETSAKDRYNQYKVRTPELVDAQNFIRELWDLNRGLEMNSQYYEMMVLENSCINELRTVDAKINLLHSLLEKKQFNVDLKRKFRDINRQYDMTSYKLSATFVEEKLKSIEKKYFYYDYLNKYKVVDYLRESIVNTNYTDVAIKYSATNTLPLNYYIKKPLNDVATSLFVQYRDQLSDDEKTVLVLYNSKYRDLFDVILNVDDFDKLSSSELIAILNKKKGFSKIKSQCYDYVKTRLDNPINSEIKNKYFNKINYLTYEEFIKSIVNLLVLLKNINNKLRLNSDINMYFYLDSMMNVNNGKYMLLTNDLYSLKTRIQNRINVIAIACLKNNLPVLYAPYCIDFGNLYDKKNLQIVEKPITKFELLVDKEDVSIYLDDNINRVVDYQSIKKVTGNITIVTDMNSIKEVNYCKMALFNNIKEANVNNEKNV